MYGCDTDGITSVFFGGGWYLVSVVKKLYRVAWLFDAHLARSRTVGVDTGGTKARCRHSVCHAWYHQATEPGGVIKTHIANGEIAPVVVTVSKHIWCCGAGSVTNCITMCIAEPVL